MHKEKVVLWNVLKWGDGLEVGKDTPQLWDLFRNVLYQNTSPSGHSKRSHRTESNATDRAEKENVSKNQ